MSFYRFVKLTLFSIFIILPMVIQPSAPQETKEKREFYDCFEAIKGLVKLSPHRFVEGDNSAKEIYIASCCAVSAQYIQDLFTAQEDLFKKFSNHVVKYHKIKFPDVLSDTEFRGKFRELLKKADGNGYVNKMAKDLFSFSKNPEHVLFYIVMGDGSHVFIVEKFNDGKESFLRIYQSWHDIYSLAEWLGIDPWKCGRKPYAQLFYEFGDGKKLTPEQLLSCMEETCCAILDSVFYIHKFDVEPNRLKYLKELLETQKKNQAENASGNKVTYTISFD